MSDEGAGDAGADGEGDAPTSGAADEDLRENRSHVFERLPATDADREVEGRPTREAVVAFWADRFGVPRGTFDGHTFWEKGAGKIWAYAGDAPDAVDVEALGMVALRVRQEHWKPTTDAVQRFAGEATRNVVVLDDERARRFVAGEDQPVEWDGDWGYLVVAHDIAGATEPVGVGLYLHGELRSQVPKGRRRDVE
jgi:NOL1/NOP2/fmu family ribosome biogenesis protein